LAILTSVPLAAAGVAVSWAMGVLVAPVTGMTAVGAAEGAAGEHAANISARTTKNVPARAAFENFSCFISFSILIHLTERLNSHYNFLTSKNNTDKYIIWIYNI
jgi:hypothetical protein